MRWITNRDVASELYRFTYNTSSLDQELYAVSDLEEANNLFGTGISGRGTVVGRDE